MRFQSVSASVFVGAMLIAAPGTATAAERSDRIAALKQIATDVGRVIAAASVCREITWPRTKALTEGFSDLVKASAANREEFSAIHQAYDQSAIDGQLAMSSKRTDCAAAVRDFADLERAIASPPPAAVATGAVPAPSRAAAVAPPAGATTGAAVQLYTRQRHAR
jgi:branched-chain amino acid transport system substrate-binding protein